MKRKGIEVSDVAEQIRQMGRDDAWLNFDQPPFSLKSEAYRLWNEGREEVRNRKYVQPALFETGGKAMRTVERGQTTAEYTLLLLLIAGLAAMLLVKMGGGAKALVDKAGNSITYIEEKQKEGDQPR